MSDLDPQTILNSLLDAAKAAGADQADAIMYESVSHSVAVRLGQVEDVERSENRDLGLRVIIGQQQACVSTTDLTPATLTETAERCVAMAKAAPEDPYCGLADTALLAQAPFPDLDMFDGKEPSTDDMKERALACEAAAMDVAGVTNSSGAEASYGSGTSWFATSHGFYGESKGGSHSLSTSVLAGEGTTMERDYDYDSATHFEDLRRPQAIGRRAGERAVKRLNPRKVESQTQAVIFDNRLSSSLLGKFAGAINGAAIARGVSFLKDKMGTEIFAKDITIIDDPLRPRGFGSSPFDGEGVVNNPIHLVENGILKSWILNTSQAKQLGTSTNGRASRGTGGPPGSGVSNLYLPAGAVSVESLISETGTGLYLTDMFGPQVNPNTGDYSVGCSGFWIENGEMAWPVSEITIAGNLLQMFASLTPADDLEFRGSINAPTFRVDAMTIAGN
ncbi:MAG: TldD/PmbA family protein [bacterium]